MVWNRSCCTLMSYTERSVCTDASQTRPCPHTHVLSNANSMTKLSLLFNITPVDGTMLVVTVEPLSINDPQTNRDLSSRSATYSHVLTSHEM